MATASKEVYCSAILSNGMEYMVRVKSGWDKDFVGPLIAHTLDGKPIVIPTEQALVFRQLSDQEFESWKASLEKYREDKLKEAQVSNLSVN